MPSSHAAIAINCYCRSSCSGKHVAVRGVCIGSGGCTRSETLHHICASAAWVLLGDVVLFVTVVFLFASFAMAPLLE